MPEYDKIAEQYDKSVKERRDRASILVPSAKHYLGDVRGLKVLDLACGSGYFTRLIKDWGAQRVVGVDISAEMISLAEQEEEQHPQGLQFYVGDVSQPFKFGDFDLVFAGFLLHYASSVEKLEQMCKAVSLNLPNGGRFIAFNENPYVPVHADIKYSVRVKAFGALCDGTKIQRTFYIEDKEHFSFHHYHYEPGTYERALRSAGFSQIEWKRFVCSEDAHDDLDPDFWKDYLGDFSTAVLVCAKQ
jgi:ubiquinone/menaquinone biosynthesis C-methylase UbiE